MTATPISDERRRIFDFRRHWHHLIHRPAFHAPVLDGVRAIAILWVLVLHMVFFHVGTFTEEAVGILRAPATAWIARGDLGVDLFFVLSGFLMGSILFREYQKDGRIRFTRFYARRFLRLIPVYTAVMILGLYMLRNIPTSAVLMEIAPSGNAENLWANLLYVNNFLPIAKQYMGWCWSLAIEEQFYLLLPGALLLFLGLGKGKARFLVAGVMLSGVIRFAVIHSQGYVPPFVDTPDTASWQERFSVLYDNLYTRFGGLLIGVIGAYLVSFHKEAVQQFFTRKVLVTSLTLISLGLSLHIAFTAFGSEMFLQMPVLARELWWALHRDVLAVATMFLILAATQAPTLLGGSLHGILGWKGFYPVAQLSYSTYLVSEMVFLWMFPKTAPMLAGTFGPYGTMAINSLLGTLLIAGLTVVLYVAIERPCMEARALPAIRNLGLRTTEVAKEPAT